MESGLAEVNGTHLHYEVAGAGEALVLLHGMGADTRVWDYCFDEFARHYRTVRYDMRGFGRSDSPAAPYRHIDDLSALLDYLDIPQTHIVGDSFGGTVALSFVLMHPHRSLSLVSISGIIAGEQGLPEADPADRRAYAEMGAAMRQGDPEGAANALLGLTMLSVVREAPDAKAHLARIFVDYFARHSADLPASLSVGSPAAGRLDEITVPCLYIIGERDDAQNQARADLFMTGIPHAQRVVMPNCDHAPLLTHPEEFTRIVLNFLQEHPAAAD